MGADYSAASWSWSRPARWRSASSAAMQPMPCGGHRLAIDVVGNIARRVYAGDVGRGRVGRGLDVAGGLHLDLVLEQLGLRHMADGDEDSVGGNVGHVAGDRASEPRPGYRARILVTQHLGELAVPHHFDLRIGEQALLQDLLSPQACRAGARASRARRCWRDTAPPRRQCCRRRSRSRSCRGRRSRRRWRRPTRHSP